MRDKFNCQQTVSEQIFLSYLATEQRFIESAWWYLSELFYINIAMQRMLWIVVWVCVCASHSQNWHLRENTKRHIDIVLYLTSEWYILQQLSYCEHFCALLEMNPGSKYLKIKDLEYYVISGNKKKNKNFWVAETYNGCIIFKRTLLFANLL